MYLEAVELRQELKLRAAQERAPLQHPLLPNNNLEGV